MVLINLTAIAIAAGLFGLAIGLLVVPVRKSNVVARKYEIARGRYVAEHLFLRALSSADFMSNESIVLPEGRLSDWPERMAEVVLRRLQYGNQLRCILQREKGGLVYRGSFAIGRLPRAFTLTLGQLDPEELPPWERGGSSIKGAQAVLSSDPDDDWAFPLVLSKSFGARADLDVHAELYMGRHAENREDESNLDKFKLRPELPGSVLSQGTDLDDFSLEPRQRRNAVALFLSEEQRGIVVRVIGNLWIGTKGKTLAINTGGRSAVIYVTGNIYIQGSIRLVGKRDSLYLIAGRDDGPSFRDMNGNGVRDRGERLLNVAKGKEGQGLRPREGTGLIYLSAGGAVAPEVTAYLVAKNDIIVGRKGATVHGGCLSGGRLLRVGKDRAGPLNLLSDLRYSDLPLPADGLPLKPGTENDKRVFRVTFSKVVPVAAQE